ncbi:MAG: caspase family protein [Alphaproteobacteria bacterium]|nr:caspase family protein [Alphaproteobacteria bacterium]
MAGRRGPLVGAALLGAASVAGLTLWLQSDEGISTLDAPTDEDSSSLVGALSTDRPHPPAPDLSALGCPKLAPTGPPGNRRIALLIGVSDYQSPEVPDLSGPAWDIAGVHRLLTDPKGGYGFPAQNICVLADADATLAATRAALGRLAEQAAAGDEVLVYFSGHGSQAPDGNGDEPDGKDETWVLHDSRVGGVGDLSDDEVHARLAAIHARTPNLTVLLDSCSSGSATKGGTRAVSRLAPFASAPADAGQPGESAPGFSPAPLPGLVSLSATPDGLLALEPRGGGGGFFTQALLDVLGSQAAQPLTWAQVARQLPQILAKLSDGRQRAVFSGALERYVFDNHERRRPLAWEVVRVGQEGVELSGPPLPGWGPGALLRVYPGDTHGADLLDPARATAALEIRRAGAFEALGALVNGAQPRPGDLAVMALPDDEVRRLPVRILSPRRLSVLDKLQDSVRGLIQLTNAEDAFTLDMSASGRALIRGPEGAARLSLDGENLERRAGTALGLFARQGAMLALRGESGGRYRNDETLRIELTPRRSALSHRCSSGDAVLLEDEVWDVRVVNTHESETLKVSAALLAADSGVFVVPKDEAGLVLGPGQSATLADITTVYAGGVQEHLLFFGTEASMSVDWRLLGGLAKAGLSSPLQRLLVGFLSGVKGVGAIEVANDKAWTTSHLGFTVVRPERRAERGCSSPQP